MPDRFDISELRELAHIMGYRLVELPEKKDCCFELRPTEAATFHDAGMDVSPVEAQKLDEWELYSKLAFAVERFVAEMMSRVRLSLNDPGINLNGEQLRDLAVYLKMPLELMTTHLDWRAVFKLAESLLEVAKQLHAAQMKFRG